MAAAQSVSAAISTIGAMRLTVNGRETPLSSRKALAILLYLALQPQRSESRERIATLLWSESGDEHARAALRQTLRRLKADLVEVGELIEADRSMLRLLTPILVDIVEAGEEARLGEPPALLQRDDVDLGRLFADLEDLDPDFNLWIAVQRERLTSQLVAWLEGALAFVEDDRKRLARAEALTRADPTHEGAARSSMQAHLALGDTVQAMRVYERLWKVLDEEFDVEPSAKTQELYVAIKTGQAPVPAERTTPAPAGAAPPAQDLLAPIAIVVEQAPGSDLPEAFRYIPETFRHEMIGALSRFRDWMIVDGAVTGAPPPTYRAYGLRIGLHLVHGTIAVAMTLTDRQSGRIIWSERQTAALDDLVRVQRGALRNLAVALNVHLSAPRLQTVHETASPMGRMYELWMQAQAMMAEWRAEAEDRATAILRDLIAAHPDFAPAMIALAQSLNVRAIIYPGKSRRPEALEEALALSARAVAIDPLDCRAHLCRCWSYAMAGQHQAGLAHLDLAMDLNENDPWTIISAALGFAFAGEIERATDLVDQARAFGMRHSRVAQGYVATALYLCGDYAGCAAAAEVGGDSMTDLPAWAAASHVHLGDMDAAAAAMETFLRLTFAGWTGKAPPSEEAAIAWFMDCFPIRLPAVAADLREKLGIAAAERTKRRRP